MNYAGRIVRSLAELGDTLAAIKAPRE